MKTALSRVISILVCVGVLSILCLIINWSIAPRIFESCCVLVGSTMGSGVVSFVLSRTNAFLNRGISILIYIGVLLILCLITSWAISLRLFGLCCIFTGSAVGGGVVSFVLSRAFRR